MAAKKKITKKSAAKKPSRKPIKKAKAAPKKVTAKKSTAARKPKRVVRKTKRPAPKRKAPAKTKAGKREALPAAPEALALAKSIAHVAHEKKASDVVVIDTRARASSVGYDYVVLASGETDRQLSAIYEGVEELLKPQGKRAASVEPSPDWVCVAYDTGVVAHFFTPDKREQVDFEGLWKDAPRVS